MLLLCKFAPNLKVIDLRKDGIGNDISFTFAGSGDGTSILIRFACVGIGCVDEYFFLFVVFFFFFFCRNFAFGCVFGVFATSLSTSMFWLQRESNGKRVRLRKFCLGFFFFFLSKQY